MSVWSLSVPRPSRRGWQCDAVFLLCLISCLASCLVWTEATIVTFNVSDGTSLESVAVHGDRVYVGGENILVELTDELHQEDVSSTGPVDDNPQCDPASMGSCQGLEPTDNHAKVLEVDPHAGTLLFCGTVLQGLCTVYGSSGFSEKHELSRGNRVNYMGGRRTVFAFYSQTSNDSSTANPLYVAHTYDDRPLDLSPPAVSSRKVTRANTAPSPYNISYMSEQPNMALFTKTDIDRRIKSDYIVKYIYGFEHEGFSYFVTVQRENTGSESPYQTRLVRVCQDDQGFYSYSELQVTCRKRNGVTTYYELAQTAHLAPIGKDMKSKFWMSNEDQALYVVFGKAQGKTGDPDVTYGSGLCMYPMGEIRSKFALIQKDCYLGRGGLLPWINYNEPGCKEDVSTLHCSFSSSHETLAQCWLNVGPAWMDQP